MKTRGDEVTPLRIRALGALVLVVALTLASTTRASASDTIDAVEEVFLHWMRQHGVTRGSLALAHGDRLVLVRGYGRQTAESRTLIASLSKAITGVCVATLVQQGTIRLDSPLGALLERGTPRYRPPHDTRLRAVTVEQLLTHRAGFGRSRGDPATGGTLGEVLARRAVHEARMHDLVPGVLRTRLEYEPGTTHVYTNAPHLLLGVVIEAVTGQRYEEYCAEAVLKPQGIQNPTLHARWAVLGSFGGWSLSGAEYLAFLRAFAPSATILGPDMRAWMLTAAGKETATGGPLFYSLLFVRPAPLGGHDFSHMGSWGYRMAATSRSGAINDSVGTRATRTAFGASWFVSFEPRPEPEARAALDRDLYRAARAVRRWPEIDLYPALGVR